MTLVEVLVILVTIWILIGLLVPAVKPPPPFTDKDLDFTSWDSLAESRIAPPQDCLTKELDLTGRWYCSWHHILLEIEPDRPSKWQINFSAGTRCGLGPSIKLERTATFENGILILDRPVQDIPGKTFQRLFAVHIQDRNYLIPSVQLDQLKEILEMGAKKEQEEKLNEEFLTCLAPEKTH